MSVRSTKVWLYRAGVYAVDHNGRRFVASQTWLSEQAEVSQAATQSHLVVASATCDSPFTVITNLTYSWCGHFSQRLWPKPSWGTFLNYTPQPAGHQLNPLAPEAAFRLQRVGAGGGHTNCGHIFLPILADTWYLDLPARRQLDVSYLGPKLALGSLAATLSFTTAGRTYRNVIFNRRDFTWVNVASFDLAPNPARIWQRDRIYTLNGSPTDDRAFRPNEVY